MITLEYSRHYLESRKKLLRNDPKMVEGIIKTLSPFVENPTHPGLHLEKLVNSPIWTIRLNRGNRIFFAWKNDNVALLLDIGKHDKYRVY